MQQTIRVTLGEPGDYEIRCGMAKAEGIRNRPMEERAITYPCAIPHGAELATV